MVDSSTLVKHSAYKQMPGTYTQFRKQVEAANGPFRNVIDSNATPLAPFPTLSQEILEFHDQVKRLDTVFHPNTAFPFRGGENAALARIKNYFFDSQLVRDYKNSRNGLVGTEYSTKFSPFLAFGNVSPAWILQELKKFEEQVVKNDSTYWVFFELLWRDYFIFISRDYGFHLFDPKGMQKKEIYWKNNDDLFLAWSSGQTGIPFVDAAMRELKATGFMSNRARQNVASFLVKDLGLDWTLGAEWFEANLLDYDPASNYGNWQYVAGVGNDPVAGRYFNVIKQAIDYDPTG